MVSIRCFIMDALMINLMYMYDQEATDNVASETRR